MKFTSFFVERPIFAAVLSVILMIVGGLALYQLPLSEYPAVSPPTVVVRAGYPGANAKTIAETVAAPLEQEINGVEHMAYMSSQATADGRLAVTVTFAQGADVDNAQVQVQNRVARALPRLPQEVQRLGVVTEKTSPDLLMVVHLTSPNEQRDPLFLSNFALLQVRDELSRVPGVGNVLVWGAGEYSMRVWLDPEKLAARQLTPSDVVRAIREQNVQVAAGTLGQEPHPTASFEIAVTASGRLSDEQQFRDIIVKSGAQGQLTRLSDVARVELGANSYSLRSLLDAKPAVAIQIIQTPGANALDVATAVRAKMAELQHSFPSGVAYRIAYDPTLFVRASIDNVLATLFEAVLLVVLVVILFLQSWRAALIPLAAVPISLVGTAAIMHLLGFSLNTLSLFGLVLSIGIVVDDAIVVVENVERHLAAGLERKEAARRAMREVTGPIIAITSVLAAVFIPTAFIGGLTGQFYRQFAITIAISTILSAFVSLTLSPALAGVLLHKHGDRPDLLTRIIDRVFGRFLFRPFNRFFDGASARYVGLVGRTLRVSGVTMLVYGGLLALTWLGFSRVPRGFVPSQDKYYLVGIAQLPPASSLDRTEDVLRRASEIALAEPGVESVVAFPGLSINGFVNAPNAGVLFAMLDPFEARTSDELSANAIAGRLQQKLSAFTEGFVGVFPPPPVAGLGVVDGFKLQIEDRDNRGSEALQAATQQLMQAASQEPALFGLRTSYEINVPQLSLDIDRARAKTQGLALGDLFDTLQIQMGSLYVNDFNRFGRTYQVNVQADAKFRSEVADFARLKVRNGQGQLVSVGSLVRATPSFGPDRVMRYNGYPSADVSGGPAPGHTTGQAIDAIERIAKESLPPGMSFEWTELTHQQKLAGDAGLLAFPLAILLAYLILAAQYNSWTLPLSVMLIVPLALLSALGGVWLTGGANDLFTQIGLIVLVGLAAKNAILIVEFARAREAEGDSVVRAALTACSLRLRPILMTSLAFIMGVVPLALATGAGAEMRRAMGIAVLSGMLGVTIFGLVLTPVFYVVIRKLAWVSRPALAVAAAVSLAWASALPTHVRAEEPSSEPSLELELSLAEALRLALQNNLGLSQERVATALAATRIELASASFDPLLGVQLGYTRDRQPPRIFPGPTDVETAVAEATFGQVTPWGMKYEVGYGVDRIEARGPFTLPGTSFGSRVRLELQQSLLRGAWGQRERNALRTAKRGEAIASESVNSSAADLLLATARSYFRVVEARQAVEVAHSSRALARELLDETRAQVAAGTRERVELTQTEAGIALREEAVIMAVAELEDASDALLAILVLDSQQAFAKRIVPTDKGDLQLPAHAELNRAKQSRPELAALRLAVENARTAVENASNALLPELALVGSAMLASSEGSLASAHGELLPKMDERYRWSAGVLFSQPIGNRAARAAHTAGRMELRHAELALREAELRVEQEVRAASRGLAASQKRVLAADEAVRLASDQLTAERRRLDAGMSTSFEVLRLETDLANARYAQLRARSDAQLRHVEVARATGSLLAAVQAASDSARERPGM